MGYFDAVNERGIQSFLLKAADKLEIDMSEVSIADKNLTRVHELQSYISVCDWKALSELGGAEILSHLSDVASNIDKQSK